MARRGRPTKEPEPGKRVSLGLKVTPLLKKRLEFEAAQSGRTQSQEAEARLEQSFDRQDLAHEFLAQSYGRQTTALLMVIGEALRNVAGVARALPLLAQGVAWRTVTDFSGAAYWDGWLDDPHVYDEAAKAILATIERLRPTGAVVPAEETNAAMDKIGWRNIGERVAADVLEGLRDERSRYGKRLQDELGGLAPRGREKNK